MKGNTILKLMLALLAIVFVVHQLYAGLYKPIVTESAEYSEMVDGLNITGMIIRNEQTVKSDTNGVLHFVAADGSRVAKNGIIANVYDSENASIVVSEIESVQTQIANMEDLQSTNNYEAADLELINSKVRASLNTLIIDSSCGNFAGTAPDAEALLQNINRRQIATGVVADFSGQLAALNARFTELNASLPAVKGKIYSAESGYFVSKADGFEEVLTGKSLDSITPKSLNSIEAKTVESNVIGKIVSDYEWYIAATVSLNDSLKHKVGDTLKLRISLKSSPILSVTVKQINMSDSSSDAVIVFSCNQMDSALAAMRSGPMTIISASYSGLKVKQSALRMKGTKTGVYVVSGMQIHFVPVKVLYKTSDYIICEQQQTSDTVLRLYDEVVVKGKNLYDGKIIS